MARADAVVRAIQDQVMPEVGRQILALAQSLVPVESGALRDSGYMRIVQKGKSKGTVEIGFKQPYAKWIHERADVSHPGGGQAKFLEQPAREQESNFIERINAAIRQEVSED